MVAQYLPVIEIFGPVIQGEGAVIGQQTIFVRFGGCDFRCKRCDSMFAVDQEEIRARATYMKQRAIFERVIDLAGHTRWITFSGGNPCLWELSELVGDLKASGKRVALETQGTYWKDWVPNCNVITVSPKGPGMGEKCDFTVLHEFIQKTTARFADADNRSSSMNLKVVIFDKQDIDFATMIRSRYPHMEMFLSLGNPYFNENMPVAPMRNALLDRFKSLTDMVTKEPILADVKFLPQLHVLLYGNEEGR